MSREIDRYKRAGIGEQLGELVPWMRAHPIRAVITLLLAAGAIGTILNPPIEATADRLSIGDCIYARTSAAMDAGPTGRPIGTANEVEAVIMSGAAERAACGLSHGHEVSLVVQLPPAPSTGASGTAASTAQRDALRADVQHQCDEAFRGYINHDLAGSKFVTFAAVPTQDAYLVGKDRGLCLIARADGQWMTSPARFSGQ